MVLMAEPLAAALDHVDAQGQHVVFPTPAGVPFSQVGAQTLAEQKQLVLICGRYEGIDQRIVDEYVDQEISLGDYVLSSGELAAMVILDAVYRLWDGAIRRESVIEDSFQENLLEYPHYTRPEVFHGRSVPDVLRSGHHEQIRKWRRGQQIMRTALRRPELLRHAQLTDDESKWVEQILKGETEKWMQ
jgi:tRNA (guanine37-N1)-methyltransferase